MARRSRVVFENQLHHAMLLAKPGLAPLLDEITKRDVQIVMRQHSPSAAIAIHGFAMLPGELHVLITPARAADVSAWMRRLATFSTQAHNKLASSRGTVWEGRFRCGLVAPERSLAAQLLVDSLVEPSDEADGPDATNHASSAQHWLGRAQLPWLTQLPTYWSLANTPFGRQARYRQKLDEFIQSDHKTEMLDAARHGWAQGSVEFVDSAESMSGQVLRPKLAGRPRGTFSSSNVSVPNNIN